MQPGRQIRLNAAVPSRRSERLALRVANGLADLTAAAWSRCSSGLHLSHTRALHLAHMYFILFALVHAWARAVWQIPCCLQLQDSQRTCCKRPLACLLSPSADRRLDERFLSAWEQVACSGAALHRAQLPHSTGIKPAPASGHRTTMTKVAPAGTILACAS